MFIVYSAAVMRIEAASGNTSPRFCQTARSTATMRMKPTPAATVAHRAESIGISTASTAPPMMSSTTSAPSMYGGFCFRSRSSIPAMRLAWISTPGKTLYRRRAQVLQARRRGADQGDLALYSIGLDAVLDDVGEREIRKAELVPAIRNQGTRSLVDRNRQRTDLEPFQPAVAPRHEALRREAGYDFGKLA